MAISVPSELCMANRSSWMTSMRFYWYGECSQLLHTIPQKMQLSVCRCCMSVTECQSMLP
jgi:hypothetical protein